MAAWAEPTANADAARVVNRRDFIFMWFGFLVFRAMRTGGVEGWELLQVRAADGGGAKLEGQRHGGDGLDMGFHGVGDMGFHGVGF